MRKFLIVALSLAGLAALTGTASADKFTLHLTKAQLENGCTAGNGHFDSHNDGYSCVTTKSTIKCTKDGSCVLTDHMILTRPTNNTHGPVAQGGNKVIGNPGNTTGAAGGPATAGNTHQRRGRNRAQTPGPATRQAPARQAALPRAARRKTLALPLCQTDGHVLKSDNSDRMAIEAGPRRKTALRSCQVLPHTQRHARA